MAYFDCIVGGSGKGNTLVVTCADNLAGATITCTNGTKTYTKTCPSTAPYEVTFYGLAAGTWTVSATVSGNTYTTTAVITDYEAELGGFSWRAWVDLSKNYTSSDFTDLDDLLDTELAVRELMSIHACVDYLAGIATESADVETIIGNDLCAKWINNRDYALDTLYANTIIKGYMNTADKYGYGEWCLMPQVPKMTSATAPYGSVSASSNVNNYPGYYAFDDNSATQWIAAASDSSPTLTYTFVNPICPKRVSITNKGEGSIPNVTFSILGSNDNGSTWTPLAQNLEPSKTTSLVTKEFDLENVSNYTTLRLAYSGATNPGGSGNYIGTFALQFYAYAPKGNVPVMTSNTAPYGEVSASTVLSGSDAYLAFDGKYSTCWNASSASYSQHIQYKSVNPICVKRFHMKIRSDAVRVQTYKIQGSNDGFVNDTHDLTETITATYNADGEWVDINNNDFYLYHRVLCLTGTYTVMLEEVQFYGRELSVSVPKMDTNTTPYGEASADSETASGSEAYRAFSQVSGDFWMSASTQEYNRYLEYTFVSPNVVKHIHLTIGTRSSATIITPLKFHFEAYDGSEWVSITEVTTHNTNNDTTYDFDVEQSVNAQKIRYVVDQNLVNNNSRGNHMGCAVYSNTQFYGLDYSEREFEEGTTKKWLYDHGVELETITPIYPTNAKKTIEGLDFNIVSNPGANVCSGFVTDSFDLTNYTVARAKLGNKMVFDGTRCGQLMVTTNLSEATKAWGSYTQLGYFNMTSSYVPYNSGLDISSFNQSAQLFIGDQNGQGGPMRFIATELWLE